MNQVDTLDSLSNSAIQHDNLILLVAVSVVGLSILLWLIFRDKPNKSDNKNKINHTEDKTTGFGTSKNEETKIKDDTSVKTDQTRTEKREEKKPPPLPPPPAREKEPSQPKFIGYAPINLFEQTEPLKFPYVIMPKPKCVIKFPQKGRSGRKGYKEEDFKLYLAKYFRNSFQFNDDRFILVKGSNKPYEPDFTLIDEKEGVNIFVDVEIDEPYEGINDIANRKATHFRFADTNRNNAFKNRGWIIIRFAEIQVHQNPDGCCLFVADVIASIHPQFRTPNELLTKNKVVSVSQWTKEEAEKMSIEKYRERYLGIDSFGIVAGAEQISSTETELGKQTEEIVKDELPVIIPPKTQTSANLKQDLIRTAINRQQFISFIYEGNPRIVKPISFNNGTLTAYCYIKNIQKNFSVASITNPVIKERPFTLEATQPNLDITRIATIINTAVRNSKYIKIKYTRGAWVDFGTGEVTEAEQSERTISNIDYALNILNEEQIQQFNLRNNNYEYINAYCNRDDIRKTFRFDRISELAILNM